MKKLALGTALWGWGVKKEVCFALLDMFYDCGERYIDTASNYPMNGLKEARYASENIISEWINVNKIHDLNIIYKLGSTQNYNTPVNNLTPDFIEDETLRIADKFGENKLIRMIHWDDSYDKVSIYNTIKKMVETPSIGFGLSGIKNPSIYFEFINQLYASEDVYIEIKSNLLESNISNYDVNHNFNLKFFAYGISISGIKLNRNDYTNDSYVNLVKGESYHDNIMTLNLQNKIKLIMNKYEEIKSMYHIGITVSEMNEHLYGYIVSPRNKPQLFDIFDFRKILLDTL